VLVPGSQPPRSTSRSKAKTILPLRFELSDLRDCIDPKFPADAVLTLQL